MVMADRHAADLCNSDTFGFSNTIFMHSSSHSRVLDIAHARA